VVVDLGSHTTKAIHMQRKGDQFALLRYALAENPIRQNASSPEVLSNHIKSIVETLDAKTKQINLAVGVADSVIRQTELPQIPVQDMRLILKASPKSYLQQDLPNHIFDCYIIPPRALPKPDDKARLTQISQKFKVLAAGAKKQFLVELQDCVIKAGFIADGISPGMIGPINSFELAMPEQFQKGINAVVDIGFKNTVICLLQEGELILSRVVAIGGDKITASLAESMAISYPEAENIKMGMPAEVQAALESVIIPLGRELRASIDFFEHQQDKHVSNVYVTGGSAKSELIIKILESEMMIPCKAWSPLGALQLALPPQQMAEVEHIAHQLTVAVGVAVSV
jgi:type IV pilus assembly protein PilM